MILYIFLDGNNIKLSIKSGRKTIAEHSWVGEYSLSERLLLEIDKLLKKNKIPKHKIKKIVPKISKTSGATSSRIVQTVAKAWNLK
jgi:tRNA A37 threonylcarbamoyladenosine modification protein TsaB